MSLIHIRYFIMTISLAILSGCATTYQERGFTGGYSETMLNENMFTVAFNGNAFASKERVNNFTLLRSAELTLQHGFKYFIIVDKEDLITKSKHYTTPTTITNYGSFSTVNHGSGYTLTKPSRSNTILCYKHKPNGVSYNAEFLVKSLKKKYGINETR